MKKLTGLLVIIGATLLAAATSSASTVPNVGRAAAADSSIMKVTSVQPALADSVKFTGGEGRIWTVHGYQSGVEVYAISSDSAGVLSWKFLTTKDYLSASHTGTGDSQRILPRKCSKRELPGCPRYR